jgi:hypothetical protein
VRGSREVVVCQRGDQSSTLRHGLASGPNPLSSQHTMAED